MKLPPFSYTKPDIPDEYTVYGLKFTVKNNLPSLEGEELKDLNKEELRNLFNESYGTFKKILQEDNQKELLDELRDIHFLISEKINSAKEWEFFNLKEKHE